MASQPNRLSPAEAALLFEPSRSSAVKCVQAALLTLLANGHVAFEQTGRIFKRSLLRIREGNGRPLPSHVTLVKNALRSEGGQPLLKAAEVSSALRAAFGNDYRHYVHDHVAPALIARGLLKREDRKLIGIFPYVRYQHSVEGRTRATRIAELMSELSDMKRLIRDNPYRARRLVEAAGIMLILSPAARAQSEKIKDMLRQDRDGPTSAAYHGGGGDEASSEWHLEIDIGDVLAMDCFDLLDGIDCASDFTGGDGGDGGDGGGGD